VAGVVSGQWAVIVDRTTNPEASVARADDAVLTNLFKNTIDAMPAEERWRYT
jgi:hypothetical protein